MSATPQKMRPVLILTAEASYSVLPRYARSAESSTVGGEAAA
jgi:hypothetical protein